MNLQSISSDIVARLCAVSPEEQRMAQARDVVPPSKEQLARVMEVIRAVLFPDFFGSDGAHGMRSYLVGVNIDLLTSLLKDQFVRALLFAPSPDGASVPLADVTAEAEAKVGTFLESLPEIKRLLCTDVQAIYDNDPAVDNYSEIVTCYPVVHAMMHYRVAHELLRIGVPVIPRFITEMAHSATGIDIHPGATIGEYFAIDHGTGVVIGETCIIGSHVTLYQGVTLGARNFSLDSEGHPLNIPRHPIIEDYVTVYSNATILGRVTIGHHSIIGGNIWLTHDVPAHARIVQGRGIESRE